MMSDPTQIQFLVVLDVVAVILAFAAIIVSLWGRR
jgi:hypothetical protein